jgi:hypothetical protein
MSHHPSIRPRDREAILRSLKLGVVPHRGLQHVAVGRAEETKALVRDVESIADGGSAVRFVIGRYGSGKTFFLHLVRTVAHEQGLVTMHADLDPSRRLQSSTGSATALYAELARNTSTRSEPEGGALGAIVERFVDSARQEAGKRDVPAEEVIREHLDALTKLRGGYDYANVIARYWKGHQEGDRALQDNALRWLRGEYTTKTDARKDLGVRTFVDDDRVYDQLKLMARFIALAGYRGLLVTLDEMVSLYKLPSTQARKANYQQILRIVNDCLQGGVAHLGFLMAGTPEFLTDPRKGLYSDAALASRLAENTFATARGLRDLSGPVLRLPNLTPEEILVLLQNLRRIHAGGAPETHLLPEEALEAFLQHCHERIGAQYFRTPRDTIKAFVQLLYAVEQHPEIRWQDLIRDVEVEEDEGPSVQTIRGAADREQEDKASGQREEKSDELTSFRL